MKVDVTTPEEEQPQTPAETDFEMVDVDVQDDAA
jgi:hypothetical protein